MYGEFAHTIIIAKETVTIMAKHDEWVPLSWHCANCGGIVTGFKNAKGDIKAECSRCRVVMVRTIKGRRHDTIDLYAPREQEHDLQGRIF